VALSELPDGAVLAGQVDGEDALLVRRGDEIFAVGASCTHYHGPLAEASSRASRSLSMASRVLQPAHR
jgi:nitrite reductase/ring-hydroxylating ferredoxin subunit